jgi:hypothetical protein
MRPIALIAALAATLALSAADAPIRVPRTSKPPVIDGKVNAAEWKSATRIPLGHNDGQAMLIHDGTFLYVALVGAKPGIGSLCVRGRTGVRILHASAALGTAAFEPENGKWKMTRGFTWTNRDTGDSEAAMADRKKMLTTEGWFANTSAAVTTEREFQIPVRGQKEVPLVLNFVSYTPEEQKVYYWPPTIEDDCADVELASGFTAREYTFDPTKWGVVTLE